MKKKNKGTNIAIIIGVILAIAVCIGLAASIGKTKVPGTTSQGENGIKTTVECYFAEVGSTSLGVERRDVQGEEITDIISNTLAELKKGPKLEEHISAIPEEVNFNYAQLNGDVLTVDLSSQYSQMKNGEEVLCRAAIVWSLTSIPGVYYVIFTVDGEQITLTNGQPMEKMGRDDIVLDAIILPETTTYETVKLYFGNDQATGLAVEERKIEVNPNQPLEKYVVEQLIAGPESSNLIATIPPETKIRDIKTTSDGICYVDLSAEFVTKHNGGSTGEMLTIYSIVDSLTTLDNINKVQFLIEGEKQNEFKGHVDFSKPFEFTDIDV